MNNNHHPKPHIVFYFSDTGGGHRSAAEAIIEAMQLEYDDSFTYEMVDFFKDYARGLLRRVPELYPQMVKARGLWEASFYATDGRDRVRMIMGTLWPITRLAARKLVRDHPADLIVTVHPIANAFALRALGRERPPFYTVATDLVTTHALWFDGRSDHIFVPTEAARERGLAARMPDDKIEVVGLPVADRYCTPIGNKRTPRKKLGWPQNKPIVLLVGGGDGMGPLARTARAIDDSGLGVAMVIVCGRNDKLKGNLEAEKWDNPTFIYGFRHDMAELMRAADIIVTKAGPGTIAEALNANLPIILYSKLPGQEDGNVTFVLETGTGVWAPKSQQVVRTLTRWITRPEERAQVVENTRRAARPDSARRIAKVLGERLRLEEEKNLLAEIA